jgi:N-acetylmuramoyl-L-alanine amidase
MVLGGLVALGGLVGTALGTGPAGPSPAGALPAPPVSAHVVVAMAPTPDGGGYWEVAADGGIFAFGDAGFFGSTGGLVLNAPIVGMATTADGRGYWLVAADGGIFAFGDAEFFGSTGGLALNAPIVGMAATADGRGYWLVAADGGIFAFGDAGFFGSTGGLALNAPIVGLAATPDGRGYWLAAADGGIFAFGDAPYAGSLGGVPLVRPIVGLAAEPSGGYWLVAADGGLFAFGGAPFHGSMAGVTLNRVVAGMAAGPAGGYWLVGQDGGLYAFGAAGFYGSVQVLPLAGLTVSLDPGHDGGNAAAADVIDQPIDGGGFIEPCDTVGAETADGYPEHAFNFDVATRAEALLQAEGATVVLTRPTDDGVGPCVNVRAAIANNAHAAAAVSIHADGVTVPGARGFTVIEPAPVISSISNNTAIVAPSAVLGADIGSAFAAATGEPPSNYAGIDGLEPRDNLGGLNLSTVPKILIECANMADPTDAAVIENPAFRQAAAQGITNGITAYLVAGLRT